MIKVPTNATRPRVTFTASGFKEARRRLESGDWRPLIRMMEEAAIDSHVAGCLLGRSSGYQRDFQVVGLEEKDKKRGEWLTGVLRRLGTRNLFKYIHKARLFRYSVVDFEWEIVDGRQTPVRMRYFDPKYFRYNKDKALVIDSTAKGKPIPRETLVAESEENPVLFPVVRDWLLKDFGLESFASFLETFGEPFIIARYPTGAGEKIKEEIDEGLASLAGSSRAKVPDGIDIDIEGSSKSGTGHTQFLEVANAGISIALLGHANAVQQSKGMQVGENTTSFKVKHEIAVDDIYFIEDVLNTRFLPILWDRNFGDSPYPRIEIDKSEAIARTELLETISTLYTIGATIEPDLLRKLGVPIADDQEPLIKNPIDIFD